MQKQTIAIIALGFCNITDLILSESEGV